MDSESYLSAKFLESLEKQNSSSSTPVKQQHVHWGGEPSMKQIHWEEEGKEEEEEGEEEEEEEEDEEEAWEFIQQSQPINDHGEKMSQTTEKGRIGIVSTTNKEKIDKKTSLCLSNGREATETSNKTVRGKVAPTVIRRKKTTPEKGKAKGRGTTAINKNKPI